MRKYAASIAKRKGIKPPRGYTKSAALGGAPAGLLTGMPTTVDNRIEDPGWNSAGCVTMTGIVVRQDETRRIERNSTRYRPTDDDFRARLHMRQTEANR